MAEYQGLTEEREYRILRTTMNSDEQTPSSTYVLNMPDALRCRIYVGRNPHPHNMQPHHQRHHRRQRCRRGLEAQQEQVVSQWATSIMDSLTTGSIALLQLVEACGQDLYAECYYYCFEDNDEDSCRTYATNDTSSSSSSTMSLNLSKKPNEKYRDSKETCAKKKSAA